MTPAIVQGEASYSIADLPEEELLVKIFGF
jgi:hypothetical protein